MLDQLIQSQKYLLLPFGLRCSLSPQSNQPYCFENRTYELSYRHQVEHSISPNRLAQYMNSVRLGCTCLLLREYSGIQVLELEHNPLSNP